VRISISSFVEQEMLKIKNKLKNKNFFMIFIFIKTLI